MLCLNEPLCNGAAQARHGYARVARVDLSELRWSRGGGKGADTATGTGADSLDTDSVEDTAVMALFFSCPIVPIIVPILAVSPS